MDEGHCDRPAAAAEDGRSKQPSAARAEMAMHSAGDACCPTTPEDSLERMRAPGGFDDGDAPIAQKIAELEEASASDNEAGERELSRLQRGDRTGAYAASRPHERCPRERHEPYRESCREGRRSRICRTELEAAATEFPDLERPAQTVPVTS